VAVDGADGPIVLADHGAGGVLRRTDDGSWEREAVLAADLTSSSRVAGIVSGVLWWFGPVLALGVWLVGRQRWRVRGGVTIALVGWVLTSAVALVVGLAASTGLVFRSWSQDPSRAMALVQVVGSVVTLLFVLLVSGEAKHHKPARSVASPPSMPPPTRLPPGSMPPPEGPPLAPPTPAPARPQAEEPSFPPLPPRPPES
jgi:hypothetical protein